MSVFQAVLWVVGATEAVLRWVEQAQREAPVLWKVLPITSPTAWAQASQGPPPALVLVDPVQAPWLTPGEALSALRRLAPEAQVAVWLPVEGGDPAIATAWLEAGADAWLPATPAAVAWLRRRLQAPPSLAQRALAHSPVPLMILHWPPGAAQPDLRYVSPSITAMLGYTPEEVLSTPNWFVDHLHPEDRALFLRLFQQARPENLPSPPPPFRLRHAVENTYRWLLAAPHFEPTPDGGWEIHLAWMDVTAHEALRLERERLLRHLDLLRRIDQAILMNRSPETLAHEILAQLELVLPYRRASVVLFDHEHGHAVVLAQRGASAPGLQTGAVLPLERFQVVAQQQRVVYDLDHGPRDPAETRLRDLGVRYVLNQPLKLDRLIIGSLNLGLETDAVLDDEALRLLEQVADQFAIALQQARLHAAERRARQAAEGVQQAVLRLTRSLQPQEILDTLLEALAEFIPYASGNVFVRDDQGLWRVGALRGYERFGAQTLVSRLRLEPLQWPTLSTILTERRALLIGDTHQDPRWQRIPELDYIRSWMGVPLVIQDEVIGVFSLDHIEPFAFTPDHLALAETLAAPAAIALQNARLFQQEQQRRRELEALREMALQLTQAQAPQKVIEQAVVHAVHLTDSQDVHIFLYREGRLTLGAAFYEGRLQPRPMSEPRSEGVTYTVARTGEPVLIPDVNRSPFYRNWPWGGALVSLPIRYQNQVLGVLNVAWPRPYGYTEDHLRVLALLADQVAVALANAELLETLRRRVHELDNLVQSALSLREASQSEAVAAALARQAAHLVQGEVAVVVVSEQPEHDVLVVEGGHNLPPEAVGYLLHKSPPTLFHQMVHTDQPVWVEDLANHPELTGQVPWLQGLGPALGLPLRAEVAGRTLGGMLVARRVGYPAFTTRDRELLEALAAIGANALHRARAFATLERAFMQTALALSRAMDARDSYTGDHSQRLAEWAVAVAEVLGLDEEARRDLYWAALLHDIGKLGIPDEVLLKPGPLTPEEWQIMRRHPDIGAEILRAVPRFERVAQIIQSHHERWDGSGYPRGLKGEAIPIEARILAVVDSYGAMVDERVYRPPRSHEEAVEEIRRNAGRLYDPRVVEAFLQVLEGGGVLETEGEKNAQKPLPFPYLPPPPDPEA